MIKGDAQQIGQRLSVEKECLENELMHIKSARSQAAQAVHQFKKQLQAAALQVEQKADTQKDRYEFLSRTLNSIESEKEKLVNRLRQLENEVEVQKDKFEHQAETLQFQYQEVEANLKNKIQTTLHHLRGLREFQEHKHQMDEQMRTVSHMLAMERKERTAELAAIHRKITAQREYYEKLLNQQLGEAEKFATQFSDLHLDLVTTKILNETEQKREELKKENSLTNEVLKRNNQLRHQLQDLEHQKALLENSEKSLTSQSVELKSKLEETDKRLKDTLESSAVRIQQLRDRMAEKILTLKERLKNAKSEKDSLKRQVALAQKNLDHAEELRVEKLKKQQDLLGVMNEAAIFVLTSLELQEKDPTKEEVVSHSGGLNAVVRKLANISQDISGVTAKKPTESITERSMQTPKTMKNGKPGVTERKLNRTTKLPRK